MPLHAIVTQCMRFIDLECDQSVDDKFNADYTIQFYHITGETLAIFFLQATKMHFTHYHTVMIYFMFRYILYAN